MSHRYSTAFSYVVLGATGIYCIRSVPQTLTSLPCIGYGLIITHSIMGMWRWGNPDHGDKSETVYNWTKLLRDIFSFPCFVGQIYVRVGYPLLYGMIHPAVSLLPLCLQLKDDHARDDVVDGVLALNIISGAIVSVLKQNYWGLAAAISFGCQHFVLAKDHNLEIPNVDLCNYAFCFVCYFALVAYGAR